MHKPFLATGALLLALALTGCAADDASPTAAASPAPATTSAAAAGPSESPNTDSAATAAQATPEEGSWVDQATYQADPEAYHRAGDVVLFFNAAWCPTCKATVENLEADGVPPGLTVVSVDFDRSSDLRKQYGVTVQHTFVQVGPDGQEQMTFTGSLTGEEISAQLA